MSTPTPSPHQIATHARYVMRHLGAIQKRCTYTSDAYVRKTVGKAHGKNYTDPSWLLICDHLARSFPYWKLTNGVWRRSRAAEERARQRVRDRAIDLSRAATALGE
ncbi:hypothetical protein WKW80_09285 [Variovorax humicola]|uniref:Uncharacterized protein n=1 Tax=Variovorax humicola TaxID=1769758 RepID=A0ABU8VZ09_9BURK